MCCTKVSRDKAGCTLQCTTVPSCSTIVFSDADDIRQEIEAETRRHLARARTMVSPDPIQLAIYSPHVPNLTMVDMPGALLPVLCALMTRFVTPRPHAGHETWHQECVYA